MTTRNFKALLCSAALALLPAVAPAFDPAAGDFSKPRPDCVRILTWNVHNNFIYNAADDGNYQRVIKAINPDIIAFQEMEHSLSAAQISSRLVSYFPGSSWYVYLGKADGSGDGVSNRNVYASRFPLSMTRQDTIPTSSIRGVAIAMVNLPNATFSKDIYMMNIHFKAGGEITDHESRQRHADALTNWMRDARTAGGNVNIPTGTPMIVTGDFNLGNRGDAAPYHASHTMLKGNIYDTTRYGASSRPDWDGTENTDASPYDYNTGEVWTHGSADPGSRIDRFYYTDTAIHKVSGFVFNSRTMTAAARSAAGGILVNDTSGASDHLPVVCDFALGPDPAPPAKLVINEYCANDGATDTQTFLEIKNVGGREINLNGPTDYWIKESDPLSAVVPGAENEQYGFDLSGVIPPGGLFVLYDSAGHSAGIASTIQSRLPALQRHDLPGFVLDNDNDSAIALVERTWTNTSSNFETPIEAYGWAAPNPNETKYFRLDSGNDRLIALGPDQWTSFLANNAASNNTVARNPGDTALNSYAGWTIGAALSPGLENPQPASVDNWCLY